MSFTGRIWPVRFVMCVTSMTRVLGVIARRKRSTTSAPEGGGTGNVIGLQDDAVAPRPLLPGRDHARVVLRRVDDLVARLQVDAEDHRLERLGGVARDRHLLGIAAELGGELAADRTRSAARGRLHMCCTGISFEKRRSRIMASRTWAGAGLQPPLFRFIERPVDVEGPARSRPSSPRRRRGSPASSRASPRPASRTRAMASARKAAASRGRPFRRRVPSGASSDRCALFDDGAGAGILSLSGRFEVARDQPRAALVADVGPRPLDHHDEPVAEADEVEDVEAAPGEPGREAAQLRGRRARRSRRTGRRPPCCPCRGSETAAPPGRRDASRIERAT